MAHLESNVWHELQNASLYWAPNFISQEEASELFYQLETQIKWRNDNITLFGKIMPIPRLQAWYGERDYSYSNILMEANEWSPLLLDLKHRCEQVSGSRFNSVLANLYRNGSDSNGWHSDNEPELGTNPVIASLSFGETRRFLVKHRQTKQKLTFELSPGSLLIMAGEMQTHWQHTVPKTKIEKSARLNLTFRYIYE